MQHRNDKDGGEKLKAGILGFRTSSLYCGMSDFKNFITLRIEKDEGDDVQSYLNSNSDVIKNSGRDFIAADIEVWIPKTRTDRILLKINLLQYAALKGNIHSFEVIKKFLSENGLLADVKLTHEETGMGLLHFATLNNNSVGIAESILKLTKEELNKTDKNGQTALHLAVLSSNKKLVELLLKNEANTSIIDNNGENPLMLAYKNNNLTIFKILLGSITDFTFLEERNPEVQQMNTLILEFQAEAVRRANYEKIRKEYPIMLGDDKGNLALFRWYKDRNGKLERKKESSQEDLQFYIEANQLYINLTNDSKIPDQKSLDLLKEKFIKTETWIDNLCQEKLKEIKKFKDDLFKEIKSQLLMSEATTDEELLERLQLLKIVGPEIRKYDLHPEFIKAEIENLESLYNQLYLVPKEIQNNLAIFQKIILNWEPPTSEKIAIMFELLPKIKEIEDHERKAFTDLSVDRSIFKVYRSVLKIHDNQFASIEDLVAFCRVMPDFLKQVSEVGAVKKKLHNLGALTPDFMMYEDKLLHYDKKSETEIIELTKDMIKLKEETEEKIQQIERQVVKNKCNEEKLKILFDEILRENYKRAKIIIEEISKSDGDFDLYIPWKTLHYKNSDIADKKCQRFLNEYTEDNKILNHIINLCTSLRNPSCELCEIASLLVEKMTTVSYSNEESIHTKTLVECIHQMTNFRKYLFELKKHGYKFQNLINWSKVISIKFNNLMTYDGKENIFILQKSLAYVSNSKLKEIIITLAKKRAEIEEEIKSFVEKANSEYKLLKNKIEEIRQDSLYHVMHNSTLDIDLSKFHFSNLLINDEITTYEAAMAFNKATIEANHVNLTNTSTRKVTVKEKIDYYLEKLKLANEYCDAIQKLYDEINESLKTYLAKAGKIKKLDERITLLSTNSILKLCTDPYTDYVTFSNNQFQIEEYNLKLQAVGFAFDKPGFLDRSLKWKKITDNSKRYTCISN